MIHLDVQQLSALYFVGGMVIGFLLCLLWLNDRAN